MTTSVPPAASPPPVLRRPLSLFWRTFALLIVGLTLGAALLFQTLRVLELEPRSQQSARQLASLVNLTRAALAHADEQARMGLVRTLLDEEDMRLAVRESTDGVRLFDEEDPRHELARRLQAKLGDAVVAREVNGFEGLWIGFAIGDNDFWLLADLSRLDHVRPTTWMAWLFMAVLVSLLGAALMASVIHRPLQALVLATDRVRPGGTVVPPPLDAAHPIAEIRSVNQAFNLMQQRLADGERNRQLMLASLSHDLRTPLTRLQLDTELSVPNPQARANMGADLAQLAHIIDQFLDFARPPRGPAQWLDLQELLQAYGQALATRLDRAEVQIRVAPDLFVWGHPAELRRVLDNLVENAHRHGRDPHDGKLRLDLSAQAGPQGLCLAVRDHGPGVPEDSLPRLTEPFFRVDNARSQAEGSGLGLSIVASMAEHLGAALSLGHAEHGGFEARLCWQGSRGYAGRHPPATGPAHPHAAQAQA